jgi:hypothetical protein
LPIPIDILRVVSKILADDGDSRVSKEFAKLIHNSGFLFKIKVAIVILHAHERDADCFGATPRDAAAGYMASTSFKVNAQREEGSVVGFAAKFGKSLHDSIEARAEDEVPLAGGGVPGEPTGSTFKIEDSDGPVLPLADNLNRGIGRDYAERAEFELAPPPLTDAVEVAAG